MLIQGRVTVATECCLCICPNHVAPVDHIPRKYGHWRRTEVRAYYGMGIYFS